jgi:intracellular septation protein
MKILFDFFPILFFFIAYKFAGIYIATYVAIGIAVLQLLYQYIRTKKLDQLQVVTLVLLVLLGGATIWLHDEIFIKWKPSIINWILGFVFLWSEFFSKKPLIQHLMESHISLPLFIWRRLNLIWAGFFTVMGFVNLYVIYHFPTDVWVNFKLFGMLGLTIAFVIVQSVYLAKHIRS